MRPFGNLLAHEGARATDSLAICSHQVWQVQTILVSKPEVVENLEETSNVC